MQKENPNVKAGFYSLPYRQEFFEEENKEIIDYVNAFEPDVLFVSMTARKQEKWVNAHKEHLNVEVICSIGAVFDFYAGTKKNWKIPANLGLEWLSCFLREPRRLWRRNLISTPCFIWDIIKAKIRLL